MRTFASSCLFALLAACAGIDSWPVFVGPSDTLVARVVASRLVRFYVGDVLLEGQAYLLEPAAAPRRRLMAFAATADCEAARTDGRAFRMHLSRETINYGVGSDPEDRRWLPSLAVSGCVLVGG